MPFHLLYTLHHLFAFPDHAQIELSLELDSLLTLCFTLLYLLIVALEFLEDFNFLKLQLPLIPLDLLLSLQLLRMLFIVVDFPGLFLL